jgi:hypothetical protein
MVQHQDAAVAQRFIFDDPPVTNLASLRRRQRIHQGGCFIVVSIVIVFTLYVLGRLFRNNMFLPAPLDWRYEIVPSFTNGNFSSTLHFKSIRYPCETHVFKSFKSTHCADGLLLELFNNNGSELVRVELDNVAVLALWNFYVKCVLSDRFYKCDVEACYARGDKCSLLDGNRFIFFFGRSLRFYTFYESFNATYSECSFHSSYTNRIRCVDLFELANYLA